MVPFSLTSNPDFKVKPLFDADYLILYEIET